VIVNGPAYRPENVDRWVKTSKCVWSGNRIKLLAYQFATVALDLLFPPHCVNCGRVGSFLCRHCVDEVIWAAPRQVWGFDDTVVALEYEGVASTAIHALKYDGQVRLVEPLGELLCQAMFDLDWPVDLVTAVPLHPKRLQERRFNQAALIGCYVALTYAWRFAPHVIRRIRETASQVDLSASERRTNVTGAFAADPENVQGMRVAIVDDVITTGATLLACADALREAGAEEVYGVALAGAVQKRND
jgi:ComF family protein